jgi:gas vesicle protein
MFFLFPLIGAAVGAVAGAYVAHAGGEKDRQSSKYHREVANKLTVDYSNLQRKYDGLENTAKKEAKEQSNLYQQHIDDLTRINARNEEEKDLLRLAIRLQQSLHTLMFEIDEQPTKEALLKFEQAVLATNTVLFKLKEELFEVPIIYFSRNSERAEAIEGKYTGQVIQGNIYPVEKCHKCGTQNRIRHHKTNLDPICGNCKHRLTEDIISANANIRQKYRESMQIPKQDFSGTFATYEPYLNWFCKYFPTMNALSREQFYRSVRYSGTSRSTEKRDPVFEDYKFYLNWFCKSFPAMAPLGQEQFYRSVRYSGTPARSTEKKKYRNDKKSKTDLSYLD